MPDPVWDKNFDQLCKIAKAFYQAYRLSGTIRMKFGLRAIPDSDGNAVVDVYVYPYDTEAASTLRAEENARHMQFLGSMVPASLLGYHFVMKIEALGADDVVVEILETIRPMLQEESVSTA